MEKELALELRTLDAIKKTHVFFLVQTGWIMTTCNSSFRDLKPSFDLCGHLACNSSCI